MPSEGDSVTRRYIVQTLGTIGAAGLAGCSGGNNSNGSGESDEKNSSDVDTTPEETTEPEPDYSLPESEHANPVDMATEWMLYPDDGGTDLQAVALSPSKLSENLDVSFSEDIGADNKYEMFEFSHKDIPETYVQSAEDPWASEYKVDQLPGNVSETSMAYQLKDAGYDFQKEIGNFKIYSDGEEFHALGENRHITILRNAGADSSQASGLMERLVEEGNENKYEPPEIVERGLDKLDVQDSLTFYKNPGAVYMKSHNKYNHQPFMGLSSVNFEDSEKHGSWPFENAQAAENGLTMLEAHDGEYLDGFENVQLHDKTITASGADLDSSEVGSGSSIVFSVPYI